MNQKTTLDKLIYALAMMLILAVLALTGLKIYKQVVLSDDTSPSNMVEHNIIKEEDTGNSADADGEGEEGTGKEEIKVSSSGTKESQGYLVETSNEAAVNFYEMHMNYNEKFHLENMFPGDAYSKVHTAEFRSYYDGNYWNRIGGTPESARRISGTTQ